MNKLFLAAALVASLLTVDAVGPLAVSLSCLVRVAMQWMQWLRSFRLDLLVLNLLLVSLSFLDMPALVTFAALQHAFNSTRLTTLMHSHLFLTGRQGRTLVAKRGRSRHHYCVCPKRSVA
jgi:hypothetical protein